MIDINDDEMPCCSTSKDVRDEEDSLLEKFLPVFVFSARTVKQMKKLESQRLQSHTAHKCSQCDYQARSTAILVVHIRTHTGEKPFQCKLCQNKFSQKSSLTRHLLIHDLDGKRFQCDLCEYKDTRKDVIAAHRLTHKVGRERPFVCDQCNFSTTVKCTLVVHMRAHSADKPFSCSLCDYKTGQSGAVTVHMLTHTGAKPFACSDCEYKTAHKQVLVRHMRTHTNEKPYVSTVPTELLQGGMLPNT